MLKKPDWLRIPYFDSDNRSQVIEILKKNNLNTVCIEAGCPNCAECFSNNTATFMILGTNCTRKCKFCNVSFGKPFPVDIDEPERIADAISKLGLKYVVITSVTRDDIIDGGASHFASVIKAIKYKCNAVIVEVLIPDLVELNIITDCLPAVIGHNIETVESLYPKIRPDADYYKSLKVLRNIKDLNEDIYTKSGIMLGLGETYDELMKTFDDLLIAGCDFLTIGQYLSPGKNHFPVFEYINPERFIEYGEAAKNKGFKNVTSAPLVRSSYKPFFPEKGGNQQ